MGPARVQGFRLKAVLAAVRAGGKQKAQALLDLLAENPYQQPPAYEALVADLCGACSRRINNQHRLGLPGAGDSADRQGVAYVDSLPVMAAGSDAPAHSCGRHPPLPVSRWGQRPTTFRQLYGEQE